MDQFTTHTNGRLKFKTQDIRRERKIQRSRNGRRFESQGYAAGRFCVCACGVFEGVLALTMHSGLKDQDLSAGIHEDSKPRAEPVGEKTTGHAPIFDSKGAVGKQFTSKLSFLI